MAASLRAFCAEYYLRRSDWLELLGWLAARISKSQPQYTQTSNHVLTAVQQWYLPRWFDWFLMFDTLSTAKVITVQKTVSRITSKKSDSLFKSHIVSSCLRRNRQKQSWMNGLGRQEEKARILGSRWSRYCSVWPTPGPKKQESLIVLDSHRGDLNFCARSTLPLTRFFVVVVVFLLLLFFWGGNWNWVIWECRTYNSRQEVKQAKLYSDLLQALERISLLSLDSQPIRS